MFAQSLGVEREECGRVGGGVIYLRFLFKVVQSSVSLTSLLRDQLVKCFRTLQPTTLIFFVGKMRKAFAVQKLFTFFSTKNIGIFEKLTFENLTKR